jgi:uncharacterized sulfatase
MKVAMPLLKWLRTGMLKIHTLNLRGHFTKAVLLVSLISGSALAEVIKPNVVFVMLDDFGYAQLEAFSRGLTVDDCDPKLLKHVEEQGEYSPEQAFEMVRRASPTLSRLADEGVVFNNAFACSNLCAPARIGFATGILQNRWGIYRNIDTEAHGLDPNSHLAEKLKAEGYATAHIGKWHIGSRDRDMVTRYLKKHGIEATEPVDYYEMGTKYTEVRKELKANGYEGSVVLKDHPLNNGFDYYFGYNQWESPFYNATNVWEDFAPAGLIKDYNTDVFSQKALQFMEQSLDANKPFYVQLHYHATHGPLEPKAPSKYYDRFDSGSYILDNFYAHVYGVDENVRQILEFLKERGAAQNTLFVFTSDNGGAVGNNSALPGNAPYSGHKGMLHLGGFRIPLFFHWPEGIKEPLTKSQLVSTLDILPTIIDAAGGDVPEGIDGKSLLPQILHDAEAPVRQHLAIGGIHARVWAFNGETSFFGHNESREKAPSGYVVVDDQYILRYVAETIPDLYKDAVDGIPAHYELYDYTKDPGEKNNLVDQFPEKVQQMIRTWDRESADYPAPLRWGIDKWKAIVN